MYSKLSYCLSFFFFIVIEHFFLYVCMYGILSYCLSFFFIVVVVVLFSLHVTMQAIEK